MNIQATADQYIQNALMATAIFQQLDQQQVDKIVQAVCQEAFNHRVDLAKLAVEETGLGLWQDKVLKNIVASQLVYDCIKNERTVGVLSHDELTGITEIAQPLGPILAIIPVTNPTSTIIFKILIALKSRNPIIISPHSRALKCSQEAARICYEAALAADAPEDCIQIFSETNRDLTHTMMTHQDTALILATGGPGLVKAAYSSGNPAIGVGPGNVPVLIEQSANIPFAVENILVSKTFDNGTICASEQAIIVEKPISAAVKEEFVKQKGYFLSPEEIKKIEQIAIDPKTKGMSPAVVGQNVAKIAELAGLSIPSDTRVLLAELQSVSQSEPLSGEILAPILAYYEVNDFDEGIKRCIDLNHRGGLGHTASIYSNNEAKIHEYCDLMDAGRIVVNTPSSQGGVGGIFNMLPTSLTLGCGSGGKNITAENVSAKHLINIKRCSRRRDNQRFCRFPLEKYLDEEMTYNTFIKQYNENL